ALTPEQAYPFLLKAWGAYIASLDSRRSPFDLWASGEDVNALSEPQKRGFKLFIGKAGCVECHTGPTFSDGNFHNVGIGQVGDGLPQFDYGLWDGLGALAGIAARDAGFLAMPPRARVEEDRGRFRTKSLRQVAETGPYFHGGQLKTLKDVVWFYNQGGDHAGFGEVSTFMVPLGLSDEEQADLVSFLESLTGAPIPTAQGCDTSVLALREVSWWGAPQFTSAPVSEPDGGFAVRNDAGEALLQPDASVLFRSKDGYVTFGTTADGGPRTSWVEPFPREFPCPPPGAP
ncbi:MAG: hypothetical protein JNM17_33220, partial [Archangium sp.]|nr:hypothetical protein [Archangium sp.]